MRKRLVALSLIVALVFGLVLSGCSRGGAAQSGSQDQTITIKLTHVNSPNSTWQKGSEKFKELVEKKSNGKIKVDIYPSGSLSGGNTRTMLEQLQSGAVDMTLHSTIIYSGFDNNFSVFSLPFLFPNRDVAYKLVDGPIGKEMLDSLDKIGIKGLAYWENGFRQLSNSKKEITKPADVAGLKVRIPEIKLFIAAFKALGANPTVMTAGELFTGLQQGVVDGQENPLNVISSLKLYEVQKYVTNWDYVWDPLVVGVNKKFFEGLSPENQKIITEAAIEAGTFERQATVEEEKALMTDLVTKGMKITNLTAEQKAAFQKAMAPIYDEYRGILGKELVDKFVNATKG